MPASLTEDLASLWVDSRPLEIFFYRTIIEFTTLWKFMGLQPHEFS